MNLQQALAASNGKGAIATNGSYVARDGDLWSYVIDSELVRLTDERLGEVLAFNAPIWHPCTPSAWSAYFAMTEWSTPK